jgi:hypothetical protein
VIINQLNVKDLSILEPENDPPVGANGDSPESFAVTFELMQAIAGEIESVGRSRGVERGQNIFDSLDEVCPDLTAVVTLEKPFQPLCLKLWIILRQVYSDKCPLSTVTFALGINQTISKAMARHPRFRYNRADPGCPALRIRRDRSYV